MRCGKVHRVVRDGSKQRRPRDRGARGPQHVTWDLAIGVDRLLARAAETFLQLRERSVEWGQTTPLCFDTFDLGPASRRQVFARLKDSRVVPPEFAVLAAEVIHGLRTCHDHMRADRKVVTMPLELATDEELALLAAADNYAKHQALPLVGSVSSRGFAVVTDELGEAIGKLDVIFNPTQAGDLAATFEFERDLHGIVNVHLQVAELLVLDPRVLGQPYDLFDMLHKEFLFATRCALPLLEWLKDHPERPLELRTATGIPLPWAD